MNNIYTLVIRSVFQGSIKRRVFLGSISDLRFTIRGSTFSFLESLWAFFFKKFANQNFLSFRIFVVRETTKFLLTLQSRQFAYILIPNVLNCTQFFYIGLHFAPNPKLWRLQRNPIPPSRWNFSPNNSSQVCFQWNTFCDHSKIFSLYVLLSQLHV